MLQEQTILQYFYKLLMWQILTDSHLDPLLTLQNFIVINLGNNLISPPTLGLDVSTSYNKLAHISWIHGWIRNLGFNPYL